MRYNFSSTDNEIKSFTILMQLLISTKFYFSIRKYESTTVWLPLKRNKYDYFYM